ncbi:hypothetical protein ACLKA7_000550 [Drosophila subpalustris]
MQIHRTLALILLVSSVYAAKTLKRKEEKNTRDLIANHGYPAEFHQVTTEDGNLLAVFRIPYSHKLQNQNRTRPVVLLHHGLDSSSDVWVLCGPDSSLPYLLADAGFDVWLGNDRGNGYSLQLREPSWNFSWHEIGLYDVAAMIDYALGANGQGQKSLHYVGHSQGTTTFLTLMSLRPEYNDRIKTAHLLSPVAIMKNCENKCLISAADFFTPDGIEVWYLSNKKFLDFLPSFKKRWIGKVLLDCWNMSDQIVSEHSNQTAVEQNKKIPQDASWNQLFHYLFNHKSGGFRQYDYNTEKNLEVYQSKQPPDYPVENIASMVHLWYVDTDDLANPVDVLALAERLPNKKLHHITEDPMFAHMDYVLHNEVRKYVNEPVLQIMQQYELDVEK